MDAQEKADKVLPGISAGRDIERFTLQVLS